MEYQIYRTKNGRRVNIGDKSYPLEVFSGEHTSFNAGVEYDGDVERASDPILVAWLKAALEVQVPLRFAWKGIMSSIPGDYGSVYPAWKPRERNWERDDNAPIPSREWKVWVEWHPGEWAEYTISDPHRHGWLGCWDAEGLGFNGYETYGCCRIATNVPQIVALVLEKVPERDIKRPIIVVGSFEELGGVKIPNPIYKDQK